MLNRYHIPGLLLVAFMSWLVHSMVPHHHHEAEICFNFRHCHESTCSAGSSPVEMGHRHDHPDNHDGCIIRQITFLPVQQSKIVIQPVQVKQLKNEWPVSDIPDPKDPGPGEPDRKWKPFSESSPLISEYLLHFCGLRAPPSV